MIGIERKTYMMAHKSASSQQSTQPGLSTAASKGMRTQIASHQCRGYPHLPHSWRQEYSCLAYSGGILTCLLCSPWSLYQNTRTSQVRQMRLLRSTESTMCKITRNHLVNHRVEYLPKHSTLSSRQSKAPIQLQKQLRLLQPLSTAN